LFPEEKDGIGEIFNEEGGFSWGGIEIGERPTSWNFRFVFFEMSRIFLKSQSE